MMMDLNLKIFFMRSPNYIDVTMIDDLLEMINGKQKLQELTSSSNENVRIFESIFCLLCVYVCMQVCVCVCMGVWVCII